MTAGCHRKRNPVAIARLRRRSIVGQDANTSDFFAAEEGRVSLALVAPTRTDPTTGTRAAYASADDIPNPANPGGVSNNARKAQLAQLSSAAAQQGLDAKLAAYYVKEAARIVREQDVAAAYALQQQGGYWGQFVSLAKAVGPAIAAVAAVAATGGLALGAVGIAGAAGTLGAIGAGASQLASGIKVAAGVAQGVQAGDPLQVANVLGPYVDPFVNTIIVPGLSKGNKQAIASVRAAADRLLAAGEAGVSKSLEIYAATKSLALSGNADAIVAVQILAEVMAQRADAGVPQGQPQVVSPAGATALAAFPLLQAAPDQPNPKNPGGVSDTQLAKDSWTLAGIKAADKARQSAAKTVAQEYSAKVAALKAAGLPPVPRVLKRGLAGLDVYYWQKIMVETLGYDLGAVPGTPGGGCDGQYTEKTEIKTRGWQRSKGLTEQDGTVGAETLRAAGPSVLLQVLDKYVAAMQLGMQQSRAAIAALPALVQVPAVQGLLIENEGERAGRINFSAQSWRPCDARQLGAVRGLVVTPAGRLALDSADWMPA